MKVKPETYVKIKADMKVVLESLPDDLKALVLADKTNYYMYGVWHRACDDRLHDDNHPRFTDLIVEGRERKADKRLLPYDPNFDMYPDGTNDDTLKTALKKAWKELLTN